MKRKQLEEDADQLTGEISDKVTLEPIQKEKVPVVFTFQPTSYFKVPADRLEEWEELLKERIGIPKTAKFSLANNAVGCVTCSPCADDCGYAE